MSNNIVSFLFLVGSLQLGWANIREKYSMDITNGNPNNLSIKSEPFIKINNGYYYFGVSEENWYAAYEKCRALGSELVAFETLDEFDAVTGYLNSEGDRNNYWTAGNDLANEGTHKWFPTEQAITIPKWGINQPDNQGGNEHCVHLGFWDNYLMNDIDCANNINDIKIRFICEAPEMDTISILVWK